MELPVMQKLKKELEDLRYELKTKLQGVGEGA